MLCTTACVGHPDPVCFGFRVGFLLKLLNRGSGNFCGAVPVPWHRSQVPGPGPGSQVLDPGSQVPGPGSRDPGPDVLDPGWVQGSGNESWISGLSDLSD